MNWHEISSKDWDKLTESEREIFLTPICGRTKGSTNSLRLSLAGNERALKDHNIRSLRKINC